LSSLAAAIVVAFIKQSVTFGSSFVITPIADTTASVWFPFFALSMSKSHTPDILSEEPTQVPPNLWTFHPASEPRGNSFNFTSGLGTWIPPARTFTGTPLLAVRFVLVKVFVVVPRRVVSFDLLQAKKRDFDDADDAADVLAIFPRRRRRRLEKKTLFETKLTMRGCSQVRTLKKSKPSSSKGSRVAR
jgi:hypothetical protein